MNYVSIEVLQFLRGASSGLHDVLLVLCGLADDLRRREEVFGGLKRKGEKTHHYLCSGLQVIREQRIFFHQVKQVLFGAKCCAGE